MIKSNITSGTNINHFIVLSNFYQLKSVVIHAANRYTYYENSKTYV